MSSRMAQATGRYTKLQTVEFETPKWLTNLIQQGFIPYIATTKGQLPYYNLQPYGVDLHPFIMDRPEDNAFLEAYLLSNSLSFKSPDYKMPGWVYVDCVLTPSCVVGFMKARDDLPATFLSPYMNDKAIDFAQLSYIPVSGQIDSVAADGSLVNSSLFSLGREVGSGTKLGLFTKALSLEVHNAQGKDYRVITQYDSPSIKVHAGISDFVEIEHPIVDLHPGKDMTLIMKMHVNFDPQTLGAPRAEATPTFWLDARDVVTKRQMRDGIAEGKRYSLASPYSLVRNDKTLLPVIEHSPELCP